MVRGSSRTPPSAVASRGMSARSIADEINRRFKYGDTFAGAYYSWAGTPWRPADTTVLFKRCWAEGNVLYIETAEPYAPMDPPTSLLVTIHDPAGFGDIEDGFEVKRATRVVIGDSVGLPGERAGAAFSTR